MCAIFGFIARKDKPVSVEALAAIVRGNIQRGPHAFGFAWIDADGRLHCFKQSGRLTDDLAALNMVRGARVVIGHLRYATHGDPAANINNHPHAADGGWIVHNGVIGNYRSLVDEQDLPIVSECDSEVIGLLLEYGTGKLLHRAAASVEQTVGGLAVMGLWARPATMIVARRGNPLHVSETSEGLYFASLHVGMPGRAYAMKDDTIRLMNYQAGELHWTVRDLHAEGDTKDSKPSPPPSMKPRPQAKSKASGKGRSFAPSNRAPADLFEAARPSQRAGSCGRGVWLNSRGQLCSAD